MQHSFIHSHEPRAWVSPRSAKEACSLIVLIAFSLLLSGCGGSSETVTEPPVVVAPRAWSAPTAAPTAFQSGNVTATPDACGGITLIGIHENIWKRQRFSPTSGWEPSAQPLFGPQVTVADEVQILDSLTIPTVFFKLEGRWHQHAYRCERNEWWGTNPLPVQFFANTEPQAAAIPIPTHFSRTFDDQILAASLLPDRSAITLQQLSTTIWDQSVVSAIRIVPLDPSMTTSLSTTMAKVSVARTADGDAATIGMINGQIVAFRALQSATFARLSEPELCFGHPGACSISLRSFALPTVEADGTASVIQNGSLANFQQPDWFRYRADGLRLIAALPSLYVSPDSTTRALRPDGVAVWLASDARLGALRIVENGVTATWTGTSEGEAIAFGDASLNRFSAPDGNSLAALRLGYQTTSQQPRLSISRRIGAASWARDFTVDLSALFARYSNSNPANPNSVGASVVAFREMSNRTWVVGALTITDAAGGTAYQPFLLWR